jgi:NAD(P)-dependent dehydrogenase (short-subunit alcohol dehydrogenase family)
MKKIAVVTGANRGLGFETCRQLAKKGYQVILACRDEKKGVEAAGILKKEDLDVVFQKLDVSKSEDIKTFAEFISEKFGRLDVLVNNAGVFLDDRDDSPTVMTAKVATIREAMETNVYGPLQLCQELVPLMVKNKYGRIVNLSSGMGQLDEMNGGYASYRLSKTAINAVTRIFSDEFSDKNILINSVCPGWVKTDMGGDGAQLEITDGVDTIVWLATQPDGSPSGQFFRERQRIPW